MANKNKTYSIDEILLIREAARRYRVEVFAFDLLAEGLTVEECRSRLRVLAEKVDGKDKLPSMSE